ncbi:YxeA family protein [Staphylococcus cohnii]|uniref:YxeA family protein n=1 Tax=Staphylococcus cohnii TaxID=29382 RepID=UPI001CCC0320|nr:YxeA family protein [Staphylococcus cohnii]MBZ8172739.1 YxeA family protein [Staphylococcus cohnii]
MNRFIKVLLSIFIIIIIVLIGLFGWKVYAEKNSDNPDIVSFAKLNPLITNEAYYVKTQKPTKVEHNKDDNGESFVTYNYKQDGYNKKSEKRHLDFNGFGEKPLKTDHFLKLDTELGHVQSYEEVSKNKVPKKALNQLK